jgi:hypothetical protein
LLPLGVHSDGSLLGIDVPYEANVGAEILVELPRHFLRSIPLAQHLDDKIRHDCRDLPRRRLRLG